MKTNDFTQELRKKAPSKETSSIGNELKSESELLALPPIQNLYECIDRVCSAAPPIDVIHGVLQKQCKLLLSGTSKSYKTWLTLDLALSVAAGVSFLGMSTSKGNVLYINFELPEYDFVAKRVHPIAQAKLLEKKDYQRFDMMHLRGRGCDFAKLLPQIADALASKEYCLIVIDPLYKGLGDRDENSAGDMNSLLNAVEDLARRTGAAVVITHHFSKGNKSSQSSIDRASGSGVLARDPDSIITVTHHEVEFCFIVESTLRLHKPHKPFVIRWEYPLFTVDNSLDPQDVKRPSRGGAPSIYSVDQILEVLEEMPNHAARTGEWEIACKREHNISRATFTTLKKKAVTAGLIMEINRKWIVKKPSIPASAK